MQLYLNTVVKYEVSCHPESHGLDFNSSFTTC